MSSAWSVEYTIAPFVLLIVATAVAWPARIGLAGTPAESADGVTLMAHWDFDATAGRAFVDSVGGSHATMQGDPGSLLRPGLYGRAVRFPGNATHATTGHGDSLSLVDQFSIELVIRPLKVKGFNTILWKGDRTATPEAVNYCVDIRDGVVQLKAKDGQGKWIVYATEEPLVEPDRWSHVLITFSAGTVRMFVNGQSRTVRPPESAPGEKRLTANPHDVVIGCGANRGGGCAYPFFGLIDEIKLYRGVLPGISAQRQADWAARVLKYESGSLNDLSQQITKGMESLCRSAASSAESVSRRSQETAETLRLANDLGRANDFQQEWLDRLAVHEARVRYRDYFNNHAAADAPLLVATLPTCQRLLKRPRFFERLPRPSREVHIGAARNEREGFQAILVGAPDTASGPVEVHLGDLVHEDGRSKIPREQIAYGWIKSIQTEEPDIRVEFVGRIPDVVMEGDPDVRVAADDFTPVLFRVSVDRNAKPGLYRGAVEFTVGTFSEKVKVHLRVYGFTLPATNSMRTTFHFSEDAYRRWYGLDELSDQHRDSIHRWLLRYRLTPNNNYTTDPCYPSIDVLQGLREHGANYCSLTYCGDGRLLTEKEIAEKLRGYESTIRKLKEAGLFGDVYLKGFDELGVNMNRIEFARQIIPRIRKAFPDLRVIQTSFPHPGIIDLFNVWCPRFDYFSEPRYLSVLEALRKQPGVEIWWYAAGRPESPSPNFFLDYPVFDCRIIGALSYMYGVHGLHYWYINREWAINTTPGKRWPEIAWKPYIRHHVTGKRMFKNGMGNFVYPGPDGTVYPSLRLENLRDGIEDYEYLRLLGTKTALLRHSSVPDKADLLKKGEALLTVPASVARAVNDYSSDPQHLLSYRRSVAEMIEGLCDRLEATP